MAGQGQGQGNIYGSSGPVMSGQSQPQQQCNQQQQQLPNTQGSDQNPNFLNQTGEQVKTMAHGAADIAGGATRGAMGIVQGAAFGAANLAQGAATAVKTTLGMNEQNSSNNNNSATAINPNNNPSVHPTTRI